MAYLLIIATLFLFERINGYQPVSFLSNNLQSSSRLVNMKLCIIGVPRSRSSIFQLKIEVIKCKPNEFCEPFAVIEGVNFG